MNQSEKLEEQKLSSQEVRDLNLFQGGENLPIDKRINEKA